MKQKRQAKKMMKKGEKSNVKEKIARKGFALKIGCGF